MQTTLEFITLRADQSTGDRCTATHDAAVLMGTHHRFRYQKTEEKEINTAQEGNSVNCPSIPELKNKIEAHQFKTNIKNAVKNQNKQHCYSTHKKQKRNKQLNKEEIGQNSDLHLRQAWWRTPLALT